MKSIKTLLFLILPILSIGQLKVEGIYPSNQKFSGEVTLLLSNEDTDPITGYTSFQVFNEIGDPITLETGPDYLLPNRYSSSTYQLRLKEEFQNLPDNLCGKLVLKNPALELDFCLGNLTEFVPIGEIDCNDHEIVDFVYAAEFWEKEVSIILTSNDLEGAGITGYSSFQLFNSIGDSITNKTGPNYILPVGDTDTIVYNLKLLDELFDDPVNFEPIDFDSSCFYLHVSNPECILSYCNIVNSVKQNIETPINIHPNPFSSLIHINEKSIKKVEIFNNNGSMVYRRIGNIKSIEDFNSVNGIYILVVYKDDSVYTKRIVKM